MEKRFDKALLKAVIEINEFMFIFQLFEIVRVFFLIKYLSLAWQIEWRN